MQYKNNAEPVGWAFRMSGHSTVAVIVQAVSVIGMFTALIGMMMAGFSLLYSFVEWHLTVLVRKIR